MDMLSFLSSINKVSFFAFMLVLFFLGYEIYLFKKAKDRQVKPQIPQFSGNVTLPPMQPGVTIKEDKSAVRKPNNSIIILLIILLFASGVITVLGFIRGDTPGQEGMTSSPNGGQVSEMQSSGIVIFDSTFNRLTDENVRALKKPTSIIIGIESIKGTDVDQARIKVNKNNWSDTDITTRFDSGRNIFYIDYSIATPSSQLKIDAQLHSKTDGWLGN